MSAIRMSPFQTPPAINAYPKKILVNFLAKLISLDRSLAETGDIQSSNQMELLVLQKWLSESSFIGSFPVCQVLNVAHISTACQRISPPFFDPILFVATQLKCTFFSLFALLSLSNAISLGSTGCDSMIILHRICQTPMNCPHK